MASLAKSDARVSAGARARRNAHPINGILVFVAPITTVLAGVVQVGGIPPHALTSVLVGVSGLLGFLTLRRHINPLARALLLAAVVWAIVTIVHLILRGVPLSNEVTIAATGFAILFGIAAMQGTRSTFRVFVGGWIVAYGLAAAAALAEKYLGYLPRNNYLVLQRGYRLEDVGLSSFFGNPNGFALFLLASSIVFFPFIIAAKKAALRAFFLVLQLSIVFFMVETNSRTGFSLLLIVLAVTYWFVLGAHPVLRGIVILVVITALATRWLTSLDTISASSMSGVGDDESAVVRINLALNGLVFLTASPLIGIGPGMFEDFMMTKEPPFQTGEMINPHNGFAELLSQYGIVVFVLVVVVFVLLWRGARADMKAAPVTSDLAYSTGISRLLLIGFLPLSATMHSTFLGDPSAWLYLAAIIAFDRLIEPERTLRADSRKKWSRSELRSALSAPRA